MFLVFFCALLTLSTSVHSSSQTLSTGKDRILPATEEDASDRDEAKKSLTLISNDGDVLSVGKNKTEVKTGDGESFTVVHGNGEVHQGGSGSKDSVFINDTAIQVVENRALIQAENPWYDVYGKQIFVGGDGTVIVNGQVLIKNGRMVGGRHRWFRLNGAHVYVSPEGTVFSNGRTWYKEGSRFTGTQHIGWHLINGKRVYVGPEGTVVVNNQRIFQRGIPKVSNLAGWHRLHGPYAYSSHDGTVVVDGKDLYVGGRSMGVLEAGKGKWQKVNQEKVFVSGSGTVIVNGRVLVAGGRRIGGKQGWQKVDGQNTFVSGKGTVIVDGKVLYANGKRFDSGGQTTGCHGKGTVIVDDQVLFLDGKQIGKVDAAWRRFKGNNIYVSGGGAVVDDGTNVYVGGQAVPNIHTLRTAGGASLQIRKNGKGWESVSAKTASGASVQIDGNNILLKTSKTSFQSQGGGLAEGFLAKKSMADKIKLISALDNL